MLMKYRVRPTLRLFAALLAALLLTGSFTPASAASLPSGIEKGSIGGEIEQFVADHADTTAGMAVAVFDRDGMIYENSFGYADVENGVAVDADTVFEWGSTTKLTVWVSVMQLWEQGKIDLNADIRTYLPEGFLTNLRFDEPVTMLHLMNHNAGFQEVLTDLFLPEGSEIPDLASALALHKPEQIYAPGTVTAYSNWGAALAGYIVERVSGEAYSDYVHEHIFSPLGIEHTAIRPDLSDNPWVQEQRKELRCYTADVRPMEPDFYYISLYPAGMCTGTISDFSAFAQALLTEDCPLFDSPDTWHALFTPTASFGDTGVPRTSHGFWTLPYGVNVVGHGGNTAGCSSYLLLDLEDGVGSVVMTNQSGESVYNTELMELIYGSIRGADYDVPPQGVYRSARTILSGPLKLYSVGYTIFTSDDLEEFYSLRSENGLTVVSYPYSDMLQIPAGTLVLELGLLLLWVVGTLFSLLYLLSWPVGWGFRKITHRNKSITRRIRLRRAAALLHLAVLGLLAASVFRLLTYAPGGSYRWMPLYLVIGIAMAILLVLMLFSHEEDRNKKETALTAVTLIFLLAAIGNIIYWQLYMFWIF